MAAVAVDEPQTTPNAAQPPMVAYATIGGCAAFGVVCGSSTATAATFARVALPEMLKRGYSAAFSTGTIAAGGTLKSLIPPSIVMILYCIVAKTFIFDLFLAAIVPALLAIVFVMLAAYLVLGAVFDEISAMLITLPFVLPVIVKLGYDPVWWGIINVVVIELGMIIPPIGVIVFLLHGLAREIPMRTIYRGVAPFIFADLALLALLAVFPAIALWLPRVLAP